MELQGGLPERIRALVERLRLGCEGAELRPTIWEHRASYRSMIIEEDEVVLGALSC